MPSPDRPHDLSAKWRQVAKVGIPDNSWFWH